MSFVSQFTLADQAVSIVNQTPAKGNRQATAFGLLDIATNRTSRFPDVSSALADEKAVSDLCYLGIIRPADGNKEYAFAGSEADRERLLGLSVDPETGCLTGTIAKP